MAVSCVTTMSTARPISASFATLVDGCVGSPFSRANWSSAGRFRNGNGAGFRSTTLSLSFKTDVVCGVVLSQRRSNEFEVGLFNVGPLKERRRRGEGARADATAAVAESEEAEKSVEKELIGQLLSLVEGSDRGANFGKEEHAKIGDMVGQLEQYSIPEPLKSPLIFGDWDVTYSSNPTSPGGNYRTWIGRLIFRTKEMIQAVNEPDIIVNAVRFSLFGFIPGEVVLRGKLEPLDEKLIQINFEAPSFQLGPLKFQYGKASSVKIAITYLDETVRLGRGSRGTVFVFTRR